MKKTYALHSSHISAVFLFFLVFDFIDFLLFDSRSTIGAIFSIFWFAPLLLQNIKSSRAKEIIIILTFFIILLINGSFVSAPLKSAYFFVAFIAIIYSMRNKLDCKYSSIVSDRSFFRYIADAFICLTFFIFSIDSFTYSMGYREFSINPNQLGIWAATYFSFGILANRYSRVIIVSRTNIFFAFVALILSFSKGALLLIALPCVVFYLFRFSSKSVGLSALVFIATVSLIYGNYDQIESNTQNIVKLKQDYIGGSGEFSDTQRLLEIPVIVISNLNNLAELSVGKGLSFTPEDGLYQQIIPHNTFFLLLSHVGIIGMSIFYLYILFSIHFIKSRSSAALAAACFIFVSMTGSPQISRGPAYPLVIVFMMVVLQTIWSNRYSKIEK